MFVVRWFCWLLSLPLIWLGQAMAMLGLPLAVPLLKAAWLVGGDGSTALAALAGIQRYGSAAAAREQADRWLAWRPQTEVAVFSGLLALEAGQIERARELLALAEQLGPDRGGMLEMLQLQVVPSSGDEASAELIQRLAARDDLSAPVRKMICHMLLVDAMLKGQCEETRRRAEHLWSIEDDPLAATALWVLDQPDGAGSELGERLKQFNLAPPQRLYLETMGNVAAGNLDRARALLDELETLDATTAEAARELIAAKEAHV